MSMNICRICGARWMSRWELQAMRQYDPLRGTNDTSLCDECNEASRRAVANQTPAMREEQRRRRVAHFGNDGEPPKLLHRPMQETDL